MKQTLILIFILLFTPFAFSQMTNRLDKLEVNDLTTKKLDVVSTTSGSKPCPKMTQVQRDAISSPVEGQCIYNETVKTINLYNGVAWVEVAGGGGEGGIANWEESTFYEVDDVVIYSGDIYQCTVEHTSTSSFEPSNFSILAQDLASTTGVLSMAKGGTDKSLTPVLGGVVYTDDLSMEVLSAGTSGQFLKSNGAAAPTWDDVPATEVSDSTFSGVLSLGKGGTSKSLTAEDGAILYSDADSVELLSPGTSGQILQSNGVGAPSYVNKSISGKAENDSSVTLEEIQVSNNQLTQTDVNKHLLESGNSNILANPSFEHSTASTSWTSSSGALAEELSIVVNGKKSLSINLSTQALEVTQDSTLYAAQFADGVQGLASAYVKTSVSGVKLCARKAGVNQTSLCVTHTGSGKWELLKVPFILGGTSNGLAIVTDSSVSGDVYVDDAFLGAASLTQNMNACNDVSCETEFSASISSTGAISGENLNWLNTVSVSTSTFTVLFNSGIFSVAPNCTLTPYGVVSTYSEIKIVSANSNESQIQYWTGSTSGSGAFNGAFGVNIICQKQGSDFTAAKQLSNGNTYSSTNADTDWTSCGHTTSSFTGFGTVSNIQTQCKRQGGDLLMKGKFTSGTSTATEARVSLPSWNGVQLLSSGTSIIPSIQLAGKANNGGPSSSTFFSGLTNLIEPSVSYLTFGAESSSSAGFTKINANLFAGTGTIVGINARIPIEGWQQSNIIIGQFNGLESCTNTLECTDTFSAKVSASGVVTDENVDWINGNASVSDTSLYAIPLKSGVFSVAPNCTVTAETTLLARFGQVEAISNSTISVRTVNDASGKTAVSFSIICQKQGVDYIGKTAKAVASDQNLRTPGSTNSIVLSVTTGSTISSACTSSPCAYVDQLGNYISSITRTGTGDYVMNFNRTFQKLKCNFTQNFAAAAGILTSAVCNSCSSLSVASRNLTGGAQDSGWTGLCHGVE